MDNIQISDTPVMEADGAACAVDRSCTLDPTEMPERTARWKKLFTMVLSHERMATAAVFHFDNTPHLKSELAELVKLERICCAHVSWGLKESEQELALTLTSTANSDGELVSDTKALDALLNILLPETAQ